VNTPQFSGSDYQPAFDFKRLRKQHENIRDLMLDGHWRTLREIAWILNYPESSISAQLRHLRRPKFGSFTVLKRSRGDRQRGLFEYQVTK
jgi:hypothetical protein